MNGRAQRDRPFGKASHEGERVELPSARGQESTVESVRSAQARRPRPVEQPDGKPGLRPLSVQRLEPRQFRFRMGRMQPAGLHRVAFDPMPADQSEYQIGRVPDQADQPIARLRPKPRADALRLRRAKAGTTSAPLWPEAPKPGSNASSTMTRIPRSAICSAADRPAKPAPTTATSPVNSPESGDVTGGGDAVAAQTEGGRASGPMEIAGDTADGDRRAAALPSRAVLNRRSTT